MDFKLVSDYKPKGDQAKAIESLTKGLFDREQHQVLLGVTGSGKTYTAAKVIEQLNRTTLVMAHNKTLAAQLYHEFKNFFPTTQLSTSSHTMTSTNQRLTFLRLIFILRRRRPSTMSWTSCGSRLRGRFLSGGIV